MREGGGGRPHTHTLSHFFIHADVIHACGGTTRRTQATLRPHSFASASHASLSPSFANLNGTAKRLHESSKPWAMSDEFTLEDLMSDDARVADDAAKSHPLAPFTRNVRARFA
jgi:hypothetical protein